MQAKALVTCLFFVLGVALFVTIYPMEKPNNITHQIVLSPEPPPPRPQIEKPQLPVLPPTVIGLIEAGKKYNGAHVCESQMHPLLMQLAKEQAQYQAKVCVQGHQNFMSRYQRVSQAGLGSAAEICAESWRWQANESMYNLGWEMFKCWRQSPGHWSVASKRHKYFGADMAQGRNGIWYACIIVAD